MASPVNVREKLGQIAAERILILDGAMGSMIQAYRSPQGYPLSEDDFRGVTEGGKEGGRFRDHPVPLRGCNDLLCLTQPRLISGIHEAYLEAGADIIETCSFNATSISLADYGLGDAAYELSAAAAALARKAADRFSSADKPRFVAGSMGPTSKSASMSPDMMDPGKRAVTWDELAAAYYDNARGLLDGGADILIIETIFDTLNAKAAIFAARRLGHERGIDVPLIVSATVSEGGRLLAGQTVEAFCVSVLHGDPVALGLNCSFGADKLKPHIASLSAAAPCLVCAYPNAGLPNRQGEYDESPETMAGCVEEYLRDGLVNIAGGCCGSTPDHIAAIAAAAKNYTPRQVPERPKKTMLSGLKALEVSRERGLTCIGERTNAAGSDEFLCLIKNRDYDGAAEVAREMAEQEAALIDVCMDHASLDSKAAMTGFLNLALQYPDIAGLPMMIDSASWDVIEAGLKCLQGKGLANSLSLKNGDAEFLRLARLARDYGAAIVVMLMDEQGPAASCERKIAIAGRAWKLLGDSGFPPEDVVFDPVVFPVAASTSGECQEAQEFIRACTWIRDNCPGTQIMGGVSNLSFSFRGRETIRSAIHAVFIKHAAEHGLSMGIVNPATLTPYDKIAPELREAVEDLILGAGPESFERESSGPESPGGQTGGVFQNPVERLLALDNPSRAGVFAGAPGQRYSFAEILPLEEARKNKVRLSWPGTGGNGPGELSSGKGVVDLSRFFEIPQVPENAAPPGTAHIITLNNYPIERVIPFIDWTSFVQTWDLADNTYPAAYHMADRAEKKKTLEKLPEDAKKILEKVASDGLLTLQGVVGFFPACSDGDDIVLFEKGEAGSGTLPQEAARFCLPRNQQLKTDGSPNPCLADFVLPRELCDPTLFDTSSPVITPDFTARLGLFALSAGFGLLEAEEEYRNRGDNYSALLLAGLANSLAEAFCEEILHRLMAVWGTAVPDRKPADRMPGSQGLPGYGTCPVFGYPSCPDRRDNEIAFRLLGARQCCGFNLTETAMIVPAASICGMYIAHPDSYCFNIGFIGEDQIRDWACRKGISTGEARKRLAGY